MISLHIHHRTTYRYRSLVAFGQHRLMLRPRESRELRLMGFELTVEPQARVTWAHDVWGNAVATAAFQAMGDKVAIDSVARIELDAVAWPVFDITASAIVYPFRYSNSEWTDLGALTALQYPDPFGRLRDWARGFVRGTTTDTLALLKDLGAGVADAVRYQSRDEEGTQSPIATLDRGWGSCRDFAGSPSGSCCSGRSTAVRRCTRRGRRRLSASSRRSRCGRGAGRCRRPRRGRRRPPGR
jgi:transglutaminase-like putative cysteine protease